FFTGTGSVNVTFTAIGSSPLVVQSGIYSMITNVLTATLTQTLSTVQQVAVSSSSNGDLIAAALVAMIVVVAAVYLLSRRKKATKDVKESQVMTCKKCGSELLPKA